MLLDNENNNLKIHEWISKYTQTGKMSVVTGYFTVGALAFLKLDKVQAKTLEPNFCHAKLYLYKNRENDSQKNYYISGSSNLTEAGIGLKTTNNVELNVENSGFDPQYSELLQWFENLWNKPQAEGKNVKTNGNLFGRY